MPLPLPATVRANSPCVTYVTRGARVTHTLLTLLTLHTLHTSHSKVRGAICTCLHSADLHPALLAHPTVRGGQASAVDGGPAAAVAGSSLLGARLRACVSARRGSGGKLREGAQVGAAAGGQIPRWLTGGGWDARGACEQSVLNATTRRTPLERPARDAMVAAAASGQAPSPASWPQRSPTSRPLTSTAGRPVACRAHLLLAISLTDHANVTAALRTRGALCNSVYGGATSDLSTRQLRNAFLSDLKPGCVHVMDFDGGLRRLLELRGHVPGLCAYALIREPHEWLLRAVAALQAVGIDAIAAIHERRHYFARWGYQMRQVFRMQAQAARLTLFRSEHAAALADVVLHQLSAPTSFRPETPLQLAATQQATPSAHLLGDAVQIARADSDATVSGASPDASKHSVEQLLRQLGWAAGKLESTLASELALHRCIGARGLIVEFGENGGVQRYDGLDAVCGRWLPLRLCGAREPEEQGGEMGADGGGPGRLRPNW